MSIFKEIADIKTADQLNLPESEAEYEHESREHVEVIGNIEENGKRTKTMICEAFSILN